MAVPVRALGPSVQTAASRLTTLVPVVRMPRMPVILVPVVRMPVVWMPVVRVPVVRMPRMPVLRVVRVVRVVRVAPTLAEPLTQVPETAELTAACSTFHRAAMARWTSVKTVILAQPPSQLRVWTSALAPRRIECSARPSASGTRACARAAMA
jgi:hypothetical protein